MNNKEKKIFIFTVIGSIVAIMIVFFSLFIPSVAILKKASERSEERRSFMEGINNYNDSLADLKKGLSENEGDIEKIKEKLLSGDDIIRIIVLLEKLAEQVNVDQKISISRQAEDKVILKNSVSGYFSNVTRYIDGAENLEYMVKIDEATFSATKDENISKVEITFNVPIYYQTNVKNIEN